MHCAAPSDLLAYAPLVRRVVQSMIERHHLHRDQEDYHQAGWLGLIDAARRYDPSRGAQFETYAGIRIRGAVIDESRRQLWGPRPWRLERDRQERGDPVLRGRQWRPRLVSLEDRDVDEPATEWAGPDEAAEWAEAREALAQALPELPHQERLVMECQLAGETLAQIGARLGVSEARSCQIARHARSRLAPRLGG